MLFYSVDRIWHIRDELGAEPLWRTGNVRLQDDEVVTDPRDAERAIHVTGLMPDDFAVFMSIQNHEGSTDNTTLGYIVGSIDKTTGDGIIVHDDSLELFPSVWMTDRIRYTLGKLSAANLAEFNLVGLSQK